tara:strand:- start:958 stop:1263 length:306 start_codon:yes stop_codon:yes gene_type:complete
MNRPLQKGDENMTTPTSYSAIRTRFYGPTNTKGARIVAYQPGNTFNPAERLTMAYDYELGDTGSHHAAAVLFIAKFNEYAVAINPEGLSFNGDMFWTWTCG